MNRREFLKLSAASSLCCLVPGLRGWAYSSGQDDVANSRLIVILLRGAMDGLNVVAPYGDPRYYDLRPKIGLQPPGTPDGLLDLDGHFGLNPAAKALMPFWQNKTLAFVHASGSPDGTRSHFQAQDYMESGEPGKRAATTGWLNRLVAQLPAGKADAVRAISLGAVLPRICAGPAAIASVAAEMQPTKSPLDNEETREVFSRLYCNPADELSAVFNEGIAARKQLNADLANAAADQEQVAANHGAPVPKPHDPFGVKLASLLTNAPSIRVAFLDFGGWDTHVNQNGTLTRHLRPLADGLADLACGLGPLLDNTSIVVMSEFGRTAAQNVNNGTDHGHGNVMFVLGGGISGGKVYGRWGGLDAAALYEGRDLPATTDFRSVASSILKEQMGLSRSALAHIFPDFTGKPNPFVQA